MNKISIFGRLRFFPIVGVLSFVILYVVAALLYPGGSHVKVDSAGFDWYNNYWCNLLDEYAINGKLNPGRPYAISGMYILCFSLAFFFYQYPHFFKLKFPRNIIVAWSGTIAAVFALLVYTSFHDLMSILACFFGTIAIIGIFFGLRKNMLTSFIWTGMICVSLLALNGYIYFSQNFIQTLPIIQKITFAAVLLWVVLLNSKFGIEKRLLPINESFGNIKSSFSKNKSK